MTETMIDIGRRVAAKHGIPTGAIRAPIRTFKFVLARHEAYAECYATGQWSMELIARHFKRERSTVWNGIRRHKDRNPDFKTPKSEPIKARVHAELLTGPKTIHQIVKATGLQGETVSASLGYMARVGQVTRTGSHPITWSLPEAKAMKPMAAA